MALIDKASLLMVPSTYEPGKLYNVLPSGNRAPDSKGGAGYDQTRADFDFDRGSNAAATRINSSGLIEKYRENVLLQSNQFDTTWNAQGVLTSGQADKDGGTSAWSFTSNSGTSGLYQNITTGGVQTFSAYIKKNATNGVRLYMFGAANVSPFFNLNTGSVVSTGGAIDATIVEYNSEWWRISATSSSTLSQVYFYATNNGGTQVVGTIIIQNAQLETGLVATDYLNSTSVTAKAGVLIDLPRINYDANGENGALLLEPSRQQLIPQSEYFGAWSKTNASVTNNSATSPDGYTNATTITGTASYGRIYQMITYTAAAYTFSVFVKKAAISQTFAAAFSQFGGVDEFSVNLNTGATLSKGSNVSSVNCVSYGDYWRVLATSTRTATSGELRIFTGYPTDISPKIFGAMIEAGSYATSYIPNHGTSGGVTRAADSCSVTGASDVIGQTEGTIFVEINFDSSTTNYEVGFAISDSVSASTKHAWIGRNNSNRLAAFLTNIGSQLSYTPSSGGIISTGNHKIALSYASNDAVVYIDGAQVASSSSVSVPAMNTAELGLFRGAVDQADSEVKQTLVFKERLTNAELATLTTL